MKTLESLASGILKRVNVRLSEVLTSSSEGQVRAETMNSEYCYCPEQLALFVAVQSCPDVKKRQIEKFVGLGVQKLKGTLVQ